MKKICENCKWWRKSEQKEVDGKTASECRKLPPVVDFTSPADPQESVFPYTLSDCFCGTFEGE
ncbi:MAG: hypothetical protein ACYTBP_02600 [Planctomycetota bacterium]|jgi:hypothetical protein